ncbi:outer membrane lipoprotein carrier protein LolA [Litoribacter alkaliphilus]|uniref:Outer membrane lipoprotein carrier protein LolA n=1 Tax=Litoribacter ruber TaxID=702568 RepID=A0AAP2CKV5_9BACT|nr:outer membrane lipoprotein carrier protein LolA [Litoribacter alkaliphilus]MBS9525569.1 outer membrane lipoprotein carrier protein LolA [Litoribacter alkaliphilus]
MRKFNFLTFVLFAGIFFGAFAQKDQQAKNLLDAVSKRYQNMNGMEGKFEYTFTHDQDDIDQTNSGKVSLKGNMYRLTLPNQEIWNDGKTSWTLIKSDGFQEVTISEVDGDIDELTPSNVYNLYKKGYNYKLKDEKKLNGKSVQEVELTAENKNNQFQRIILYIDKGNNNIQGWKMWDNSGGVLDYQFKDLKTDANLPDSHFVFHKGEHPGVEIIDLR